jgi:glycosyltransferase involved in cell wall biosynthesis
MPDAAPTRDAVAVPARDPCPGVVVLIPALNESLRIRGVVQAALAECPRVIVVDDGSDDGTDACIADLPITLIRHASRMGKGAALRDGFREALRLGARGIVTLDGDGQHDPRDIPRLLAAARRHPRHIVIGARLRHRSQQPWPRRLANAFGDWGIGWACGFQLADSQSGQRYYPAEVAALEHLPGEDFVYEAELLISAARRLGVPAVSVPIEARYADVHAAPAASPVSGSRSDATAAAAHAAPAPLRRSHFRPLHDLWRIVRHVSARILERGRLVADYRTAHAHPPVIDDGDPLGHGEDSHGRVAHVMADVEGPRPLAVEHRR